jgi:hypothetical protein
MNIGEYTMDKSYPELKIDPEFKSLSPPLSKEEYEQLEKSILAEGCRDAIVTWNGVIVDGHNRYEICTKHNKTFKTIEKHFKDRDDAKIWIFENQKGRRNLNKFQRTKLALELKDVYSRRAQGNLKLSKGRGKKGLSSLTKFNTRNIIAKEANVSEGTVHKVTKILENANESQLKKLNSGIISIDDVFRQVSNKNEKKTTKELIESYSLSDEITKRIHNLVSLNSPDADYLEVYIKKIDKNWKGWGKSIINRSHSMKQELLAFINKYHLGGRINAVKWTTKNNVIETLAMSSDKNMVIDVVLSDIFNFNSELNFGILTTDQLVKQLKFLSDDISIDFNFQQNTPLIIIFSDSKNSTEYMLSDLSVIPGPKGKGLKKEMDWNLEFEITKSIIKDFQSARQALPETKTIKIIPQDNSNYRFALGYATVNTNRISLSISPKKVKNPVNRIFSFNSVYFGEILQANKNADEILLRISYEGIAHLQTIENNIIANYYLLETES